MTDISPLPWEHVAATEHHGAYIVNCYGGDVCDLYAMSNPGAFSVRNGGDSKPVPFTDMDANAAFIVKAVNNHEAMVKALEEIQHRALAYVDGTDAIDWCDSIANIARDTLARVSRSVTTERSDG